MKRAVNRVARASAGEAEVAAGIELLDDLVRERSSSGATASLMLGELRGFAGDGAPLVSLAGAATGSARPARSLVPLAAGHIGRSLVFAYADGDPRQPIVLGLLDEKPGPPAESVGAAEALQAFRVEVGETRIELHVDREIVVRCGAASLTLAPDGRVVVRGTHVLSRASASNRIKGGTVQIN